MGLSRGKRSTTLDMRNKASIKVLEQLAPSIDVVVENAKPGSMETRGFGYPQCNTINTQAAPLTGDDTVAILRAAGFTDIEIEQLADGAII